LKSFFQRKNNIMPFYIADIFACCAWAIALALLVISVGSIFN
tara:strand:- start:1738 stop:1863 length:126 start_codon:yes stop_codon:yes gene_type:complete